MQKRVVGASIAGVLLLGPAVAGAHLERPSYWPDPAPDTSVTPPAGGKVPTARSLASAVTGKGPGKVRVVCQSGSLKLAKQSIRSARKTGFKVRPSQPTVRYSAKQARARTKLNKALFAKCKFKAIQPAINASSNNDRVVIMPGVYTEPAARKAPLNDKRCNPSMLQHDASGDATPSYEYQVKCPHDQNLVYVQGRALGGAPLETPLENRQGIPEQELGACVRCNLQVEGSGPKPTDVIIDAGTDYDGTGVEAKPAGHAKHVVFRVDRADGFVGRNILFRGGLEFGFYVEEADGVLLDRTDFFWNADYGHLSFTTDHSVVKNCDGFGAGDAAVYPGAAPETGAQATDFYPDAPRANTVIKRCDLRGSELGYSGSMGNAVRITNNHIYGNTTGIASDTLSSGGHPGFPADSSEIDHNFIYSNNFNVYSTESPVKALVTVPVGTGIVYAGMNSARVHDNWFFDNWRYGAMLFAVPDALTSNGGPEGEVFPGVACTGPGISTSCDNRYFDNKLGQVPPGFEFPAALDQFGVPHGSTTATVLPNGHDFWWDEWITNTGNCWFDNTGPNGAPITDAGGAGGLPGVPPNVLPDCAGGTNPGSSVGGGDAAKLNYLIDCSEGPDTETGPMDCDWWQAPAQPGSAEARRRAAASLTASRQFATTAEARALNERAATLTAGG